MRREAIIHSTNLTASTEEELFGEGTHEKTIIKVARFASRLAARASGQA
jgi:predicted thioesterase